MICAKCGAKNDKGSDFCGQCGNPLTAPPGIPQLPVSARKKSGPKKALLYAGIAVLLIIILITVGFATGWIKINPSSANGSSSRTANPHFEKIASHEMVLYPSISFEKRMMASFSGKTITLFSIPELSPVRTLEGHDSDVWMVNFSPDGTLLASVDKGDVVKIWRVEDGTLLHTFQPSHTDQARGVYFIANDRVAYLGFFTGSMRVWKVHDGSLIWDLQGEVSRSAHELFSPDGKYMAEWSSFDLGTYLMDLQTGNYLNNFYANHSDVVTCAAISPDSQLLATGSDDATVQIWSIPRDQQIATLTHDDKIEEVLFSPDGKQLFSSTQNGTAWIWSWKENRDLVIPSHSISAMDVSADGKLLVAGTSDGQVLLFNATDATLLGTLSTDQTTAVNRIEVSPDGEWLVAVSGDVLTTWRNDP